jgi:hypothetical protein
MTPDPEDDLELEVTLTFQVPVSNTFDLGPREAATHARDQWVDSPEELTSVVARALGTDDYTLQVKPFSEF